MRWERVVCHVFAPAARFSHSAVISGTLMVLHCMRCMSAGLRVTMLSLMETQRRHLFVVHICSVTTIILVCSTLGVRWNQHRC